MDTDTLMEQNINSMEHAQRKDLVEIDHNAAEEDATKSE